MPGLSTPLTIQASGSILSSAFLSGSISALSICAIPAIQASGAGADGLARAWRVQFTRGLHIPATAAAAALNYLYVGWRAARAGQEWRGFVAGGLANLALMPFTLLFIQGVNSALSASLVDGKALSREATGALVARWGRLNVVRIFMPLAGAALGLWNLLV
ncbi:hypothetical protein F4780DRAFT_733200 [Xylariomycetidae sp. FL0641]|nr:hypothetical protein F4780DRAFT_733200 [Xylariomycetidae sp. FL0641]